ncbi:MAG TPA: TadE/TadG family type IV pilus assembly protein [Alphaproteobacteria bacterium]|nr:TadE/TadG family type IV pilus assembly protein [Alphaproteobacteria bacterium]
MSARHMNASWWRSLLRQCGGNAALELAFLAPPLMLLAVGTVDYGLAMYNQIEVQNAAQAGAEYVLKHGYSVAGISGAVTSATPLTVSATPAPTQTCGCPSGTSITPATCGTSCPSGLTAGTYVTVNAQATYTTLVPYPGISSSYTLTASSTVRY